MRILDRKKLNDSFVLILEDGREIEIDEDIYFEMRIYSYEEITDEILNLILAECSLKKAKRQLSLYISMYPYRSEFMYYKYLLKKGYDSATAQKAVAYFVETGYINEIEAANRILKKYEKRKTVMQIKEILRKKGFKISTITKLDLSLTEEDEIMLEKLIKKRIRKVDKNNRKEIMKIVRWLVSKGYDYNRIMEKIKELLDY